MKHQLFRLTLAMILAGAINARADAVLDWNAIAATTIFAGGRPGPSTIIDFAVVQATTDRMTFTVTSNNPNANPNSRTYASFTDAALDVVEARILQGIHTRSADLNGRRLGQSVAKWVFKHALRPVKPGYDDDDHHSPRLKNKLVPRSLFRKAINC